MGKQIKTYLFSAIVSYFIFFLLRDTGVLGPPIVSLLLEGEQLPHRSAFSSETNPTRVVTTAGQQDGLTNGWYSTPALRGSHEQQHAYQRESMTSSIYDLIPSLRTGGTNSANYRHGDNKMLTANDNTRYPFIMSSAGRKISTLPNTNDVATISRNHAAQDAASPLSHTRNDAVAATAETNVKKEFLVGRQFHRGSSSAVAFSTSSHILQPSTEPFTQPIDETTNEAGRDKSEVTPSLPKDTHVLPLNPPVQPEASTETLVAAIAQTTSAPRPTESLPTETSSISTTSSRNPKDDPPGATTTTVATTTRPTMHTFFEYIPPHLRGAQMSDEADHLLLREWISSWEAAGWNTKIISLADAKQHSDYEMYAAQLQLIPLMGEDGLGNNIFYNQLCFLRWLAMAAVGGGYMSDYDVFPLTKVPSDLIDPQGNFTIHAMVKSSRPANSIPCLMSGRSSEWTRMAHLLVQSGLAVARNNNTITMWSDMMALIDLRKQNLYHALDMVVEGQDVLLSRPLESKDCIVTKGKMAIHFSHEALRRGHLLDGETIHHRAQIARRFFVQSLSTQFHEMCSLTKASSPPSATITATTNHTV